MQFEERTGKFSKVKNKILLEYEPDIDTIYWYYSMFEDVNVDTTDLPPLEPSIIDNNGMSVTEYIVRKNKLIPIFENRRRRKGKLVRIDKEKFGDISGAGIRLILPDSTDNN